MRILIAGRIFETLKTVETVAKKQYPEADVRVFTEALPAKQSVLSEIPDVAIVDVDLENGRGKALAATVHEVNPRANLILLSRDEGFSAEAIKLYPSAYLVEPITEEQMKSALQNFRFAIPKRRTWSSVFSSKKTDGKP